MAEKQEPGWGIRVIALLMGVVLWLFVGPWQRLETDTRRVTLAVDVKNAPSSMRLSAEPPSVEVSIEGPRQAVARLDAAELEAFVDLKHRWQEGEDYPIKVLLPPGIKAQVLPAEVRMRKR